MNLKISTKLGYMVHDAEGSSCITVGLCDPLEPACHYAEAASRACTIGPHAEKQALGVRQVAERYPPGTIVPGSTTSF